MHLWAVYKIVIKNKIPNTQSDKVNMNERIDTCLCHMFKQQTMQVMWNLILKVVLGDSKTYIYFNSKSNISRTIKILYSMSFMFQIETNGTIVHANKKLAKIYCQQLQELDTKISGRTFMTVEGFKQKRRHRTNKIIK